MISGCTHMNRLEGRRGLSRVGGGATPRGCRAAGDDLLLDLFQDVSHLAEEVLREEATVVTRDAGASVHSDAGRVPGQVRGPPLGDQSGCHEPRGPAPPLQALDGMMGPV